MRSRKRSICASGSGKVPSSSIGFWVASTRKGRGSGPGDAVDGHLPLFHRLEQGRLGARAGAVDLVGQHDLGDKRPGAELEVAAFLVEDADAHDVGGQQVGRELDALEGAAERARQRLGQHGLADARHVLQQDVALAEQGDQQEVDDLLLADDDAADIGAQSRCCVLHLGDFGEDLLVHSG